MRLPSIVIFIGVAIVVLLIVLGAFLLRGINLGNSTTPDTTGAAPASSEGSGFALPASNGMATFTPAPRDVPAVPTPEVPTVAQPTQAPPPAEPTQAPVPTVDVAVQATMDAANAAANNANGVTDPNGAQVEVPPVIDAGAGGAPVVSGSNTNIQVTPVPAVPVNGSGGGTSGGGNSGGDSGNTGGGAACGTRLIHVVRPGENLFRIGLRYNTTAYAIARLNGITNVRLVASGRRLVIVACARGGGGGGGQYTPRSTTYVVKAGDTLFRIALRFGINTSYLCHVNGLTSNLIVPGQVLVIP